MEFASGPDEQATLESPLFSQSPDDVMFDQSPCFSVGYVQDPDATLDIFVNLVTSDGDIVSSALSEQTDDNINGSFAFQWIYLKKVSPNWLFPA